MGRFISPDWSKNPQGVPYAAFSNPQSLNLYSYVGNNPLGRVDADGHEPDMSQVAGSAPLLAAAMADSDAMFGVTSLSAFREAQQQSSSSGGFWHHVSNLFHGHGWNYVKATVTVTETETVREPNEAVTAATDAAGLVGTVAPKVTEHLHLGPLSAGASILKQLH